MHLLILLRHIMKKYSVLLIAFLISCYSPEIYKPSRSWKFNIIHNDKITDDFITLNTFDDMFGFQIKSTWEYKYVDNGDINFVTETTGIVEHNESNILSRLNIVQSKIWLHPPRPDNKFYNLKYTELIPFPYLEFPIESNKNIPWELTLKDGWKEWEGVNVTGNILIKHKFYYDNKSVMDSCWLIEAIGNSSIGTFDAVYYYNESKGYVYFKYIIKNETIELVLSELKL